MSNSKTFDPMAWIKKNRRLVIIGGVVIGVAAVIFSVVQWINSIDNDGYDRQRDVLTQYNQYQTALSTCLDQTNIGGQIASEEYDQVRNVLTGVVGARYGGDEAAALSGDAFVSALAEQYPEIDRSLWKQLMTTALGCRQQVAGVNNDLQSLAGRFDRWANTGGVIEKQFRQRYPTDELKVIGLNGPLSGQAALDFLTTPITTGQARQAIRTQEMPTQDLFGSSDTAE